MRDLLGAVLAILMLSPRVASLALADDDHDRARDALTAGQIRPLKDIVGDVQRRCGGKVIEVELEQGSPESGPSWLYQLDMMMPTGDVLRLDVDAATTRILQVKGRGAEAACR